MEQWKEIDGYEGYYQINRHGDIKSLKRIVSGSIHGTRTVGERILKQSIGPHGYIRIRLRRDSIDLNFLVHRLVANTFIPNPERKKAVNHINGIKHDNSVDNLEWVTNKENSSHAYENGLITHDRLLKMSKIGCATTARRVKQMEMDGTFIKEYDSLKEAADATQGKVPHITRVCQGKLNSTRGFKWQYS